MSTAAKTKYVPSKHALERARLRYGVDPKRFNEWINELMSKAKYVASNGMNGLTYAVDELRIVIDDKSKTVITIHDEPTTAFIRPILERELRKLNRLHTRSIRKLELEYAKKLQEHAEMVMNRAKARNPKTRQLISKRIQSKQDEINELITKMERIDDDFNHKRKTIEVIAE